MAAASSSGSLWLVQTIAVARSGGTMKPPATSTAWSIQSAVRGRTAIFGSGLASTDRDRTAEVTGRGCYDRL